MSKKIAIEPCFNEAHFLEFQIPNVCDYLKPDIFVIAEGMFPKGPENLIENDDKKRNLIEKYTLNGEGKRSFDFERLKKIIDYNKKKYSDVKFYLLEMDYVGRDTAECYQKAYTSFLRVAEVKPDDVIFTLECDLFFTKTQAETVLKLSNLLAPDKDFGSTYIAFFESPRVSWWTDARASRRIVYKYGTGKIWGNHDGIPGEERQFGKTKMHNLKLFHYDWIRPQQYWDFRMTQVNIATKRRDHFNTARSFIRQRPPHTSKTNKILQRMGWHPTRPWLSLNNLILEDHPKHIKDHENFKYYYNV